MTSCPPRAQDRRSSAAASSAARSPIISARWAPCRRPPAGAAQALIGLDLARGGTRRPAAHQRHITQLLGYSVALYDRLEPETGLATGWKRNGGLRLACNEDALDRGETPGDHRAQLRAGDASPHAQGGAGALAADEGRRRGRRRIPAHRRPGEPDRHRAGARQGCAHAPASRSAKTCAVTGIASRRTRCAASRPTEGSSPARSSSICARPMVARDRRAWRASTCRSSRCSINTSSPRRSRASRPDLPTLRDPDRLTYYKEEVGGLVMGGYEPNPHSLGRGGHSRRLRLHSSSMPTGTISSRIMELALPRVPALETAGIKQLINGPGELHAGRQLHPGRGARGARLLRRRGLQRLRHRVGRRCRHGARGMGRQGRAALRPLAGRHPPLRPQPSRLALGAGRARSKPMPNTTRSPGRPRSISSRPAAPPLAALRSAEGAERLLRREARLGAAELVRRPPASGRGHLLLSAGRTGSRPSASEHRAARERVGALRPDLVRQILTWAAAMPRRRSPVSARTTSPSRRARSPTRRC